MRLPLPETLNPLLENWGLLARSFYGGAMGRGCGDKQPVLHLLPAEFPFLFSSSRPVPGTDLGTSGSLFASLVGAGSL